MGENTGIQTVGLKQTEKRELDIYEKLHILTDAAK